MSDYKSAKESHPSERFAAPDTVRTGVPLKHMMNAELVELIAASFAAVHPGFATKRFIQDATQELEALELKDRARHIAHALARQMPEQLDAAVDILIASLGPKQEATQDFGLAPFFYMPQAEWIGLYTVADLESGLRAIYELTQRFTAEYCVRPFLIKYEAETLQMLHSWCGDPNPHVRRLVSEGSRARLPWAMRLKQIQTNPALTLPLLEKLKDDPELYVRRSVANHLGDIAKDYLDLVLDTCTRWLQESQSIEDANRAHNRRWLIRHALRYPAKKGNPSALAIRMAAK